MAVTNMNTPQKPFDDGATSVVTAGPDLGYGTTNVPAANNSANNSANSAVAAPARNIEAPPELDYTGTQIKAPTNKFKLSALQETGQGQIYTGRSSGAIVDESSANLAKLLDEDNEVMKLSKAAGARAAEARGLGGSSLRQRASQAAAIQSAMPLVQQGSELSSQQYIAAQQNTARSQMEASSRKLQELLSQQEVAARTGDNEAARELSVAIANESNTLDAWKVKSSIESDEYKVKANIESDEYKVKASIESNEYIETKRLDQTAAESLKDRDLQVAMQGIDIDYRKWLEQTTFDHQEILQGNAQASSAYSQYIDSASQILNNPETSAAQKRAAIEAIKTGLTDQLELISSTADIDLSNFLPSVPVSPPRPSWLPGDGIVTRGPGS